MHRYNDDAKTLLLSDTDDTTGNGHIRNKSVYSTWLKYILPFGVVILVIVFIILLNMGSDSESLVIKNEYHKPIDWGMFFR
jgi:hypothetical protein